MILYLSKEESLLNYQRSILFLIMHDQWSLIMKPIMIIQNLGETERKKKRDYLIKKVSENENCVC